MAENRETIAKMTLETDDAGESAAHIVKLATADWRRVALLFFLAATITSFAAYRLAANAVSGAIESQASIDAAQSELITKLDARVMDLEKNKSDIQVMKNDIAWIKNYLMSQPRQKTADAP